MPFQDKHPAIKFLIDQNATAIYGRPTSGALALNICVSCTEDASSFTSEVSKREYHISGLCQSCQDEIFNDVTQEQ